MLVMNSSILQKISPTPWVKGDQGPSEHEILANNDRDVCWVEYDYDGLTDEVKANDILIRHAPEILQLLQANHAALMSYARYGNQATDLAEGQIVAIQQLLQKMEDELR